MSDRVPTLNECMRAAARIKLQRTRTRKGTTSVQVYLFQLYACILRGGHRTSGSCAPAAAGALLIAADGSIRDTNAALLRASQMLDDYIDLPHSPSFSELVADRALLLLRAGWRRKHDDVARDIAEHAAQSMRLCWYSV